MSEPFLAEIKIVSFNFAPQGWALCNGQLLPINQNQALFSILGTTYGGNGQTNFALPDLRGRSPFHYGSGFNLGQAGGEAAHTLTTSELPTHIHFMQANSQAGVEIAPSPARTWAQSAVNPYNAAANLGALHPSAMSNVGGSQAHNNMQPYLVLNFIICLIGIFPSRN
jgi:microcystin-dependent protein